MDEILSYMNDGVLNLRWCFEFKKFKRSEFI